MNHTELIHFFTRIITEPQYSHAYLLYGPPQTGKKILLDTALERVAAGEKNFTDPDMHRIYPDEKTDVINVDAVRQLQKDVSTKPLRSKHVILIPDVDKTTESAANALLKLIEEPPTQALFLLTTSRFHAMPVTVRSRCTSIYVGYSPDDLIQKFLKEQHDLSPQRAATIVRLAEGRLSLADHLAREESHFSDYRDMTAFLLDLLEKKASQRIIQDLPSSATDSVSAAMQHLHQLRDILRDILLMHQGISHIRHSYAQQRLDTLSTAWSVSRIVSALNTIRRQERHISPSVNNQLLFENTLLQI